MSVAHQRRDLAAFGRARPATQAALDPQFFGIGSLAHEIDLQAALDVRGMWLTQPRAGDIALQQADWLLPRLLVAGRRRLWRRGSLGLGLAVERERFVGAVSAQLLAAQPRWRVSRRLLGSADVLAAGSWGPALAGQVGYVAGFAAVRAGPSFAVEAVATRALGLAWSLGLTLGYGPKRQTTRQASQQARQIFAGLPLGWRD